MRFFLANFYAGFKKLNKGNKWLIAMNGSLTILLAITWAVVGNWIASCILIVQAFTYYSMGHSHRLNLHRIDMEELKADVAQKMEELTRLSNVDAVSAALASMEADELNDPDGPTAGS